MNSLDKDLAQLFAQQEPDTESEAFVASVRQRVAQQRSRAKAMRFCLVAAIAGAAGAVVTLTPQAALYPVHLMQGVLTSPIGAIVCAFWAIGLTWWTRCEGA